MVGLCNEAYLQRTRIAIDRLIALESSEPSVNGHLHVLVVDLVEVLLDFYPSGDLEGEFGDLLWVWSGVPA